MSVQEEYDKLLAQVEILEKERAVCREEANITLKSNEDVLASLRKENATLQQQAAIHYSATATPKSPERIEKEIAVLRQKVDELTHQKRKLTKCFQESQQSESVLGGKGADTMTSDAKLTRRKSTGASAVEQAATSIMDNSTDLNSIPEIRSLETRLTEVSVQYHEAQSISRTYAKIARRIREESALYDQQMLSTKGTLVSNKTNSDRMRDILSEARLSVSVTKDDLQMESEELARNQQLHADRLAARRAEIRAIQADMVQVQTQMQADYLASQKSNAPLISTTVLDTSKGEPSCSELYTAILQHEAGMTDPGAFAQKCLQQRSVKADLEGQIAEFTAKTKATKETIDHQLRDLADMNYVLDAHGVLQTSSLSGLRDEIMAESQKTALVRERYTSMEKSLGSVITGLANLVDKMALLRMPTEEAIHRQMGGSDVLFDNISDHIKFALETFSREAATAYSPAMPSNDVQRAIALCLIGLGKLNVGARAEGVSQAPLRVPDTSDLVQDERQDGVSRHNAEDLSKLSRMTEEPEGLKEATPNPTQLVDESSLSASLKNTMTMSIEHGAETVLRIRQEEKCVAHDTLSQDKDLIFEDSGEFCDFDDIALDSAAENNIKVQLPDIAPPSSKAPMSRGQGSQRSIRQPPQILKNELDPMDRALKRAAEDLAKKLAGTTDAPNMAV